MKLLADVHISPMTISALLTARYEIIRTTDYIPAKATDKEIIDLALQNNAVIVTQDLDFSALIAQRRLNKPSVISLRVGDAKPGIISALLERILPLIEKDLMDGAIISVEEHEYRIRKLPI